MSHKTAKLQLKGFKNCIIRTVAAKIDHLPLVGLKNKFIFGELTYFFPTPYIHGYLDASNGREFGPVATRE